MCFLTFYTKHVMSSPISYFSYHIWLWQTQCNSLMHQFVYSCSFCLSVTVHEHLYGCLIPYPWVFHVEVFLIPSFAVFHSASLAFSGHELVENTLWKWGSDECFFSIPSFACKSRQKCYMSWYVVWFPRVSRRLLPQAARLQHNTVSYVEVGPELF